MNLENKLAYRIIKVLHIVAYIFLAGFFLVGLFDVGRIYHSATDSYSWGFGTDFWWFFFGSLIGVIIIELIYRAALYIVFGKIKKK